MPDYKLPKTYKTLLMLLLVFGPFYWLAFTDDGRQRTDLALMFILDKPAFNAALDAFNSQLTEVRLRKDFPDLVLHCADGANPFGNRLCSAEIGSFNGLPASTLTLFFANDQLRAVKVVYRRAYHNAVQAWVHKRTAVRAEPFHEAARLDNSDGVQTVTVTDGALFMRDGALDEQDEPALLWLSQAAIDHH